MRAQRGGPTEPGVLSGDRELEIACLNRPFKRGEGEGTNLSEVSARDIIFTVYTMKSYYELSRSIASAIEDMLCDIS
jgi:hypothetical protein